MVAHRLSPTARAATGRHRHRRRSRLVPALVAAAVVFAGCAGDDPGGGAGAAGGADRATTTVPATTVDTTPPEEASFPVVAAVTACPRGVVLENLRGYGTDPTRPCVPSPVTWRTATPGAADGVVLTEPLRFQALDSRNVFSAVVFDLSAVRIDGRCRGTAVRTGPEATEVVHLRATERDGTVRLQLFLDPEGDPDRRPAGRLELAVEQPGFFDERCAR